MLICTFSRNADKKSIELIIVNGDTTIINQSDENPLCLALTTPHDCEYDFTTVLSHRKIFMWFHLPFRPYAAELKPFLF